MPIRKVHGGYKFGKVGKVYRTKKKAEKQMRAMYAHGLAEETKDLPTFSAVINEEINPQVVNHSWQVSDFMRGAEQIDKSLTDLVDSFLNNFVNKIFTYYSQQADLNDSDKIITPIVISLNSVSSKKQSKPFEIVIDSNYEEPLLNDGKYGLSEKTRFVKIDQEDDYKTLVGNIIYSDSATMETLGKFYFNKFSLGQSFVISIRNEEGEGTQYAKQAFDSGCNANNGIIEFTLNNYPDFAELANKFINSLNTL